MISKMSKSCVAAILAGLIYFVMTDAIAQYYENSYAFVVGIDKYASSKWPALQYAKKDAQSVANFLRHQGFAVIELYDEKATKTAIIAVMQNHLARRLKENDRVFLFFAGHGYTEQLGGDDFGYIIPYDGKEFSATYISMEELRAQSDKMKKAKHQLFIFDSCYGGLFGTRGVQPVNKAIPNYLGEITKRSARQFITAGGKDQQVLDGSSSGHSFFTQYLLEALQGGFGDINNDGYITFTELAGYLIPRASNAYQTPASGTLPGHGLGEFIFRAPQNTSKRESPKITAGERKDDNPTRMTGKRTSKKWLWIGLGTAALGGGAVAILAGGGNVEDELIRNRLPDPPGAPTGN